MEWDKQSEMQQLSFSSNLSWFHNWAEKELQEFMLTSKLLSLSTIKETFTNGV